MTDHHEPATAAAAFKRFVTRVLEPSRAERFATLASSEKGQRKVLDALCHKFESAVLVSAIQDGNFDSLPSRPCFAFHTSCGFGASFPTFAEAYDALYKADGWLILDVNGSIGAFRPEGRWDDQIMITG